MYSKMDPETERRIAQYVRTQRQNDAWLERLKSQKKIKDGYEKISK